MAARASTRERLRPNPAKTPAFIAAGCCISAMTRPSCPLGELGRIRKTAGVTTYMLDSKQAAERGRATGRQWKGGVFRRPTARPIRRPRGAAAALMKLGGSVHQHCAARGIELSRAAGLPASSGGRRHQDAHGRDGGGARASFCRQLGIRFPQASIRQSILSVSPIDTPLPMRCTRPACPSRAAAMDAMHSRSAARARVDLTPQFLRFAPQFVPMFAKRWRNSPGARRCAAAMKR